MRRGKPPGQTRSRAEPPAREQCRRGPSTSSGRRGAAQDAKAQAQDAKAQAQDAEAQAQDAKASAQDAEAQAQDAEAQAQDAEAQAQDAKAQAQDAKAPTFARELGLPLLHKGKVRELYALDDDRLLMVATDQISAFDFVLEPTIPDKGRILTQLSLWWFEQLDDVVANHALSWKVPAAVPAELRDRAVVCERLDMVPVECVARGYLTGSGWTEYRQSGTVCGIGLPTGLLDGSRLPEPLFTPTTKADLGEHDASMTFAQVVDLIGEELAEDVRARTLAIYDRAEAIARERGLLLADTKFEFGRRRDGTLVLADEALTPDSSRFWDEATWRPGEPLSSFDKQYVRDWLLHRSGWDRQSDQPPPPLPDAVVEATRQRYLQAYERLTGRPLA